MVAKAQVTCHRFALRPAFSSVRRGAGRRALASARLSGHGRPRTRGRPRPRMRAPKLSSPVHARPRTPQSAHARARAHMRPQAALPCEPRAPMCATSCPRPDTRAHVRLQAALPREPRAPTHARGTLSQDTAQSREPKSRRERLLTTDGTDGFPNKPQLKRA